jgi:hypothetical protein
MPMRTIFQTFRNEGESFKQAVLVFDYYFAARLENSS